MSTHDSNRLVKTEAATFCEDYESYFGEENNEEGTRDEVVIYSCANGFEPERTKVDIEVSDYNNGKEHSAIKEDNKETKYGVVETTIKRVKQKDAEDALKRKRVQKKLNVQGKIVANTVVENRLSSIKPETEDDFHDPVSSEIFNNDAVTSAKFDFQDKAIIRKDKKRKQKKNQIDTNQESRKRKVSIQCEDCQTTFKHRANYENHIFDSKCKTECKYCGKVFLHGKFANYKMHLKYHRNDYNFQCQECGIKFMARSRLIKHQQKHNKPYKCDQCSVGFTSESALYIHKVTGHTNKDGKYPCPECYKEYATRQSLANHMSYNHPFGGVRYLPCSVCGMLCKERNLKKHEATHNTKSHKCDQCPSAFKTKESLTQHKKRHSKSYSELCKICGRGCYGTAELREHMRVHTGEKPYTCSLCDYRCALRGNLKLQMKVHDKSK